MQPRRRVTGDHAGLHEPDLDFGAGILQTLQVFHRAGGRFQGDRDLLASQDIA